MSVESDVRDATCTGTVLQVTTLKQTVSDNSVFAASLGMSDALSFLVPITC
jgi:hypothetical protein